MRESHQLQRRHQRLREGPEVQLLILITTAKTGTAQNAAAALSSHALAGIQLTHAFRAMRRGDHLQRLDQRLREGPKSPVFDLYQQRKTAGTL